MARVAADFTHAVLHVEFLGGVARPGQRQAGQHAFFIASNSSVEEIAAAALMAEDQPVPARRFDGLALVQEGAEWRDAGAGSDHDDRRLRILGQREILRFLHIDLDPVIGDPVGEEGRGDAEALALADDIANAIDRQGYLPGVGFGDDEIE